MIGYLLAGLLALSEPSTAQPGKIDLAADLQTFCIANRGDFAAALTAAERAGYTATDKGLASLSGFFDGTPTARIRRIGALGEALVVGRKNKALGFKTRDYAARVCMIFGQESFEEVRARVAAQLGGAGAILPTGYWAIAFVDGPGGRAFIDVDGLEEPPELAAGARASSATAVTIIPTGSGTTILYWAPEP